MHYHLYYAGATGSALPSVEHKGGPNKALQVKSYLSEQNCVFLKDDVILSQFSSFLFAYRRF